MNLTDTLKDETKYIGKKHKLFKKVLGKVHWCIIVPNLKF